MQAYGNNYASSALLLWLLYILIRKWDIMNKEKKYYTYIYIYYGNYADIKKSRVPLKIGLSVKFIIFKFERNQDKDY